MTCIRLGMKSPVRSVVVFAFAFIAHFKNRHGGVVPVVGNSVCNGVARPAVNAVYKRVQIASVVFVKQLFEAVIAY